MTGDQKVVGAMYELNGDNTSGALHISHRNASIIQDQISRISHDDIRIFFARNILNYNKINK